MTAGRPVNGDARVPHRAVLAISLPIIASNVSTPLLGLVDTAIMGQLGNPVFIGAVAVGAAIFSFLYWGFGFLRMGTTGLTAQAEGAEAHDEVRAVLVRALAVALAGGVGLIALQWPVGALALTFFDASQGVETLARDYYAIRIWSAPAALINYAILGWFIGLGRAGHALVLQIVLNGVNIVLDAWFVLGLGMTADGVALGTVLAEIIAALTGLGLIARLLARHPGAWVRARLLDAVAFRRMLGVNGDILIRTLCLVFAFAWFTAQGARADTLTLAANAVLLNFLMVSAYLLDGYAFAAETLVGKALGAGNEARFRSAVNRSFIWAIVTAAALSVLFWLAGPAAIDVLSTDGAVRQAAREFLPWAALAPFIGVFCFQLDGIFIGATRTADMRNMMILSLLAYLAAWAAFMPLLGNHGLWLALMVFFVVRGVTLGWRYPALLRDAFGI